MTKPRSGKILSLTDCVEAYEQSIANGLECAIESFAPNESHPEYAEIVMELVRVEMEHLGWQQESAISRYCERFPIAFADPAHRSVIAFEEFRVRRQHGEAVTRLEYAERYRIDTTQWPSVATDPEINLVSEAAAATGKRRRLARPVTEMDAAHLRSCVAEAFPEFEPVEELGRGAFGRVFLAKQRNLAGRLVVIKITSDTTTEPERLARLQHTNIVPVYSVHRTDDWQAICMPFFGRRTLRDYPLKNAASSLRLMEQVATALEHAHRNGILHRDVKPANILVTDDGQPMLLDFNLSSDSASQSMRRSIVGGTVPYLSPEQLQSLKSGEAVSETADIYSLGVILFELLAGQLPFEFEASASLSQVIRDAQAKKSTEIPRIRTLNHEVSISVQDIILKCLQPDSGDRYQSAADLAEDLRRERRSLPLKYAPNTSRRERLAKWRRRHPRVLSVTTLFVSLVALLAIGGVWSYVQQQRVSAIHAESQWQEFRQSVPAIRTLLSAPDSSSLVLSEGLAAAQTLVDQYHVTDAIDWHLRPEFQCVPTEQQQSLDEELSEIVFLMSAASQRQAQLAADAALQESLLRDALKWNSLASKFACSVRSSHTWQTQRSSIQKMATDAMGADPLMTEIEAKKTTIVAPAFERRGSAPVKSVSGDDAGQLRGFSNAIQQLRSGDAKAAHGSLLSLVQLNPHDYSAWYLLGKCRQMLGLHWEADAAFSTCIAVNADCWVAWQDRAAVRLKLNRFQEAAEDCAQMIHLRPDAATGYLNRALAEISLGNLTAAENDLNLSISHNGPTRAYFLRSQVRLQQGNQPGAKSDFETGLQIIPNDVDSWVTRGMAHLQQDPKQALADFQRALELNPQSRDALQNSAHVLSEKLGNADDAVRLLDQLLSQYPDDNPARIGRAVLCARAGQDDRARSDAEVVLANSPDAISRYQVACVFALTSQRASADADAAIRHLSDAMRTEPQLYSMAEQDSDLNAVRNRATFQKLLNACRSLMNPDTDVSAADLRPVLVDELNGD
ncbi:MAG: protein kinase [Planctomycetaceae bacterium]|nr:protein kinase [Planctomycetaceae bacterium]